MISIHRIGLAIIAGVILSLAPAAMADDTGFADMHDMRREGAKTCMSDHYHHGTSSGQSSRKLAEIEAGRDWAGFTAFEYGSAWANYALAASKSVVCDQDGKGWGCSVAARPCRRGGTSVAKSRRQ